jgi:hypothetical protein
MSVVGSSVYELNDGRSAKESLNAAATATRVFRCETSSANDNGGNVLAYTGFPQFIDTLPGFPMLICVDRDARPNGDADHPKFWLATFRYETFRGDDATQQPENPIDRDPKVSWGGDQFETPAIQDIVTGNAILNTAGDPFDPPKMIDDSRLVVTVDYALASVPTWILDYRNSVNAAAFTIEGIAVGIKEAKLSDVTVSAWEWDKTYRHRKVRLTLHLNDKDWRSRPLNEGLHEIKDGKKQRVLINGHEAAQPVPLDINGLEIPYTTLPGAAIPAGPFDVYPAKDFTVLNIPS